MSKDKIGRKPEVGPSTTTSTSQWTTLQTFSPGGGNLINHRRTSQPSSTVFAEAEEDKMATTEIPNDHGTYYIVVHTSAGGYNGLLLRQSMIFLLFRQRESI